MKTIKKYKNLFKNISNKSEYLLHKSTYQKRVLHFITKPNKIFFDVPATLYIVFKEIFMEDFYGINNLLKALPQNPVVIDIGANGGYFSVLLLSKNKDALVYAYEPLPGNIKRFQQILDANKWLDKQIKLFAMAVGAKANDVLELFMGNESDETSVASVFQTFHEKNHSSIKIPSTNLENIFTQNNLVKIDLLKMDCEGSEYGILYSAPEWVFDKIGYMAIETHNMEFENYNHIALKTFLESKKYITQISLAGNGCYYLQANKQV